MADVFSPLNKSLSLSVTTASAAVTLDATSPQVCIHNDGTSTALIVWGSTAQTATTSDGGWLVSIPAGGVCTFTKGAATSLAAITASGTATLRISQGVGP